MSTQGKRPWRKFVWCRKEVTRTTWRFRLTAGLGILLVIWGTHAWVLTAIGRSLVHPGPASAADTIVLEHYDPDYLVFERARDLQREGLAARVIIPCQTFSGPTNLNVVSRGIIDVMTRVSGLRDPELMPLESSEPYTLNTVRAVAKYLDEQDLESVIVVSPMFRSRRSHQVYETVLGPMGIDVSCVPARSITQPDNWWKTTHGIQSVGLEFGKLWYYRLFVL